MKLSRVRQERSGSGDEPDAVPWDRGAILGAAGLALVALVLLVVGFVAGRTLLYRSVPEAHSMPPTATLVATSAASALEAIPASGPVSAGAGRVEVPSLVGMRADEAVVVLQSAGFAVVVSSEGATVSSAASRTVLSQQPTAGTIASASSTVTIAAPPFSGSIPATSTLSRDTKTAFVVCIDPGHQAHADQKLEPIGPGSKIEKPRASGGVTGVSTAVPEYEVALQLAMNLKARLEAAGVKVVMTRTTNDVFLPNSARAIIANKAHADLFVRIHCSGSPDTSQSGITTVFPSSNEWTKRFVSSSKSSARTIEAAACAATGAASRGTQQQADLVGFNWATEPSVLVEAGFLSNPVEDKLLTSPAYQDRLAQGVSDGILRYLKETRP